MEFKTVCSSEEALETLTQEGGMAKVLAGGSDLMLQLKRKELEAGILVHIQRASDLKGISSSENTKIGSLVSHTDLLDSSLIRANYGSLAYAASSIGGWQTQVVGTIGGNVANASPAADLIPPLLVHGAEVHLASKRAKRSMPLNDFLIGRRKTALAADELIVGLSLELKPKLTADKYLKVGRRSAMEVAIVGLAVRMTLEDDLETISNIRIAVASCGPKAFLANSASLVLTGNRITPSLLSEAGEILLTEASPVDDIRASAIYRKRLLPKLLEQAIVICAETIQMQEKGTK